MSLFPSVDTSLLPEFDSDVADVLEDDKISYKPYMYVISFIYFFIAEMQLQRTLYLLIPQCLLTSLCHPPTHPQHHYQTPVKVMYLQMETVTKIPKG
jgi:hypothetical protein